MIQLDSDLMIVVGLVGACCFGSVEEFTKKFGEIEDCHRHFTNNLKKRVRMHKKYV